MPAPLPGPWSRARWIIRTQLAALSQGRKHTPGIHTRATGFIPFTGPARDSIAVAWREARRLGYDHWGPGHLLLGLASQDDSSAGAGPAGDQLGGRAPEGRADRRRAPAAQTFTAAPPGRGRHTSSAGRCDGALR